MKVRCDFRDYNHPGKGMILYFDPESVAETVLLLKMEGTHFPLEFHEGQFRFFLAQSDKMPPMTQEELDKFFGPGSTAQ